MTSVNVPIATEAQHCKLLSIKPTINSIKLPYKYRCVVSIPLLEHLLASGDDQLQKMYTLMVCQIILHVPLALGLWVYISGKLHVYMCPCCNHYFTNYSKVFVFGNDICTFIMNMYMYCCILRKLYFCLAFQILVVQEFLLKKL